MTDKFCVNCKFFENPVGFARCSADKRTSPVHGIVTISRSPFQAREPNGFCKPEGLLYSPKFSQKIVEFFTKRR